VIDSGLFVGTLRHRRFAPIAHAFTYPLFMALLDIDRLPELMRVSRLTSYNRWNWATFDDRDHLGDVLRRPRFLVCKHLHRSSTCWQIPFRHQHKVLPWNP